MIYLSTSKIDATRADKWNLLTKWYSHSHISTFRTHKTLRNLDLCRCHATNSFDYIFATWKSRNISKCWIDQKLCLAYLKFGNYLPRFLLGNHLLIELPAIRFLWLVSTLEIAMDTRIGLILQVLEINIHWNLKSYVLGLICQSNKSILTVSWI